MEIVGWLHGAGFVDILILLSLAVPLGSPSVKDTFLPLYAIGPLMLGYISLHFNSASPKFFTFSAVTRLFVLVLLKKSHYVLLLVSIYRS